MIKNLGKWVYHNVPVTQPFLKKINNYFNKPPDLVWQFTTLPWMDDPKISHYLDGVNEIKNFEFDSKVSAKTNDSIDVYRFRHWYVSFAVRHAIHFANSDSDFVECGVSLGWTALFTLKEIGNHKLHLYDAWGPMLKENLTSSEYLRIGKYKDLDVNITKRNLSKYSSNTIYHVGSIPNILQDKPLLKNIPYLHIDVNASKTTLEILEFFYPKLKKCCYSFRRLRS